MTIDDQVHIDVDHDGTAARRPGRPRLHDSDTARVKAWRDARRVRAEAERATSPEGAEATLGAMVGQLSTLSAEHQGAMAALAARIEAALGSLSDPDQVGEALSRARSEALAQVAEAEARASRAAQSARADQRAREEAETMAEASLAREDETAALLEAARAELVLARGEAEAARDAGLEQLSRVRAEGDAQVLAVRSELEEVLAGAEERRARAEGEASILTDQLAAARAEVAQAVEAARADLAERLGERHLAELSAARARCEVDRAHLEARAAAAEQVASARAEEVERLVTQLGMTPSPSPRRGPRPTTARDPA